jgi:hypothetical protein
MSEVPETEFPDRLQLANRSHLCSHLLNHQRVLAVYLTVVNLMQRQ